METTSGNRPVACGQQWKRLSKGRQRKAFRTDKPNRYAFLSEKIEDVAFPKISTVSLGLGNIDWECNLPYLEASARRWCELHGEEYTVKKVHETPLETVGRIYRMLADLTHDEKFEIDYIPEEKMIKFLEYSYCDFPEYTVFYLPLVYFDRFPAEMREIMMSFASWMLHNTIYLLPYDCYDFEMILECFDYESAEDDDEEVARRKQMTDFYRRGKAAELFRELSDRGVTEASVIHGMIERLDPHTAKIYSDLIGSVKQGLKIMSEDNLRNHTYYCGFCSDERFIQTPEDFYGGEWVYPDRLFVFTYGEANEDEPYYDEIAGCALHSIGEEVQNGGQVILCDGRHLTPDDTEPFVASEKPLEWSKWYNDFVKILINEQTDTEAV